MNTRPPAVAGSFYEETPERLRAQVNACFAANEQPAEKRRFIGAVVPHAGLMYSGHVAAAFYALAELPKRFIILCPNHTGFGHFAAINREGSWRTPLGDAKIDTRLADALMSRAAILADDRHAHAREHSLEVQLPFLQQLIGDFTFVPICLGARQYDVCETIGNAIADVARDQSIGILASSDLNHYEDQKETLRKDQIAIDAVLALTKPDKRQTKFSHGERHVRRGTDHRLQNRTRFFVPFLLAQGCSKQHLGLSVGRIGFERFARAGFCRS